MTGRNKCGLIPALTALTVLLALAAQTLAAEDTPVEINGRAFVLTVPEGLSAGKLYNPDVRAFVGATFGGCEAFLAYPAELNTAGTKTYSRFVVVTDPDRNRYDTLDATSFRQNYVDGAIRTYPNPVLTTWSSADQQQAQMLQGLLAGTSLKGGGDAVVGVFMTSDSTVGLCTFQNAEGRPLYPNRHPMVTAYSYVLVAGKLFQFIVVSELAGPEDIDWVMRISRTLSTSAVPMVP